MLKMPFWHFAGFLSHVLSENETVQNVGQTKITKTTVNNQFLLTSQDNWSILVCNIRPTGSFLALLSDNANE